MEGLRLCALALHAVAGSDRAWLLARLPDGPRRQLTALVEELRGTGIPADPELVRQLVRESELLARNPTPHSMGARLLRASAPDVWSLLRSEPDALVCRVVRRHEWPWKAELLELCGPVRARRIEALAMQLAPAEALEQAVMDELEQRLGTRPSTAGRSRPARWQFLRREGRSA
ncbi:hypothetical protein [Achromobacter xylosoxidans]|uniref:hypothetical protein n=1 Tax=Alcaligenes xylosoxydans xylosoxydans TaxID=85698 RepID=UPI00047C5993|nr:hypothetical protein [Achromobacter xylosoxidans]MCH4594199.1 hypothetical protein [Achromobacter xylosoxidans]CUI48718.1 Uncharacterised protein [Achromobacter xylosoxidans]CUJ95537.1 Uncharacterised protein [Achromobacter xylosoxidans]